MSTKEFNNRFNEMTPSLNSFAYTLTKNEHEAKDLYQETAFRAFSNSEKFKPGTNMKAWLMTIMKNIFINNYRKKSKRQTIVDQTDNLYFLNSGDVSIFNAADQSLFMDEVGTAIEQLDDSLRIPFLRYFEGFKYHEIAEELGLPLGTVKSRIFFARKELKSFIKDRYASNYELVGRIKKIS